VKYPLLFALIAIMNQMVLAQNDEKKSKIDLTVLNWTTLDLPSKTGDKVKLCS